MEKEDFHIVTNTNFFVNSSGEKKEVFEIRYYTAICQEYDADIDYWDNDWEYNDDIIESYFYEGKWYDELHTIEDSFSLEQVDIYEESLEKFESLDEGMKFFQKSKNDFKNKYSKD